MRLQEDHLSKQTCGFSAEKPLPELECGFKAKPVSPALLFTFRGQKVEGKTFKKSSRFVGTRDERKERGTGRECNQVSS